VVRLIPYSGTTRKKVAWAAIQFGRITAQHGSQSLGQPSPLVAAVRHTHI
jgi:hypothetical protein